MDKFFCMPQNHKISPQKRKTIAFNIDHCVKHLLLMVVSLLFKVHFSSMIFLLQHTQAAGMDMDNAA